ncbi:MAG: tetratricopeptide repeat protein [Burkholderiales bacterium]
MTLFCRMLARAVLVAAALAGGAAQAGLDEGLAALARRDYATATKELRPLAERGDAEAQYRIGLMYEFGRGYPVDKAQGIAWFRKSAAQGHTAAQQELGVIYTTGDGVPKDDAQAVEWFRKAATAGNPTAQFNLGLMIAKGAGVRQDDAQAVDWFRKAAAQGFAAAQFKLGVAYENGSGVAVDPVLSYASYAIAARGGNPEYVAQRDAMAARLTPAQAQQGLALAGAWTVGQPMPTRAGSAGAPTTAAAAAGRAKDTCSATGFLGGEKFSATHCAVSLYGDQHSVGIWFNEDPITPQEQAQFQVSSYADAAKGGKPRTMLTILFCPGGGTSTASPQAVRTIDLNTNHAKSPLAGVQWVVEAPRDFKVEKLAGEIAPGAVLSGRIVGKRDRTSWTLDFDVTLPAKDAAAGMSCSK